MRTLQRTHIAWLLLLSIATGCQEANQYQEPPPPKVTVALPLEEPVQEYFETTGQTQAVTRVELRARVNGYLKEIHFQDGELVEKDQLLMVIDKAPYEAAVASAEAAVAKAEAQLRLADQQLERFRELAAREAATENTLDIRQAEQAAATADVASAQAALQTSKLDLNYTEIRAPFAGRMGRHLVDVGNLVQSGETLLAPLESVDPIHAYFTVSESDLLRFMEMQREGKLKISEADPITIELAIGETEDFAFSGKLDFREFGIDPQTGTTQRRAVYPNPDAQLIPGLFVKLRAAVGEPTTQLLVEERAIGSEQRGEYVLVVNDKNIVEQKTVELGILKDGLRAIESGLAADDRVVINGLQRARPASEVNPEEVTMGAQLVKTPAPPTAPTTNEGPPPKEAEEEPDTP